MKKIFWILLAVMPLLFASCERLSENYLLGEWQVVEYTTNKYKDGKLDYSYYENCRYWLAEYATIVQFLSDNTYNGNLYGTGSYVLNEAGDRLTLTPADEEKQPLVLEVTRISNKEFEVKVSLEKGMSDYNGWGFDIVGVPMLPVEVVQHFEKMD